MLIVWNVDWKWFYWANSHVLIRSADRWWPLNSLLVVESKSGFGRQQDFWWLTICSFDYVIIFNDSLCRRISKRHPIFYYYPQVCLMCICLVDIHEPICHRLLSLFYTWGFPLLFFLWIWSISWILNHSSSALMPQ